MTTSHQETELKQVCENQISKAGGTRIRITLSKSVSSAAPVARLDPLLCTLSEFGTVAMFSEVPLTYQDEPTMGADKNADSDRSLEVLILPTGATAEQWKAWIHRPGADSEQSGLRDDYPLDMVSQGDRFLLKGNHAAFVGDPDRLQPALQCLAEFFYYRSELERLEQKLHENWSRLSEDVHLTHGVTVSDLKSCDRINITTEWIVRLRLTYTKLAKSVTAAASTRVPTRKTLAELIEAGGLETQMESLEKQLECYENVYESANDRLSEFSYFHKEYQVELWITVLLILEVVGFVVEIVMQWGK